MGKSKVRIEHNGKAWRDIFTSPEMQALTDEVGQRIAREAGENFEYERAGWATNDAVGVVKAANYEGCVEEAEDKVLTRAIHK